MHFVLHRLRECVTLLMLKLSPLLVELKQLKLSVPSISKDVPG